MKTRSALASGDWIYVYYFLLRTNRSKHHRLVRA